MCYDTGKLICLICMSVRESLYKSLPENNRGAWLTPASCRGFFSWLSDIRVGWLISSSLRGPSPQALTLMGGARFIAWRQRRLSLGECRRGLRHFWSRRARVDSGPAPGPTLKKALCHTRPVSGTEDKYRLISSCFEQRLFSWLSGIRVGWLISSSLRAPSLQALTLFGGARFIAWRLRRPSLGECRRGPRHFWSGRACLGHGLAPGPT